MHQRTVRITLAVLAGVYVLTGILGHAHAANPLGIGAGETAMPSTGMFSSLLNWINVQQQEFYRTLSAAMKSMRDGDGGFWLLTGVSFAYGVFHAAGPGHGKAVISSYMLANEVALRRGIVLSFVSAFLQGVSAIVMMALVYLLLRGTSISMADATRFLEISSFVLITLFGAWLLWRKAGRKLVARLSGRPAASLSAAVAHDHSHDHAHGHSHDHHHHDHGHHHHGPGEVCESCGHSHAPDPSLLNGEHFDWRSAWTAVAAVGIRPCSGALIVLTFAFLNGMWAAGIASVFAMSLGTGITVAALATLAVTAKNVAVAFAGNGRAGNTIHNVIEIGGALFIMLIGLTLLAATLYG
ncbi:MAG: nickel/cobalt transporter [Mesorhizobium sp.]